MKEYLKRYRLILRTNAPVFVGSGNVINKKEYIFAPEENKVYIPNLPKLYELFEQKQLVREYESYLLDDFFDFSRFMKNNQIRKEEYLPAIQYTLDSGDAVFETKGKKEIHMFVKDAYGLPYIPGSSIKGALRTVLLSYGLQGMKKKRLQTYQKEITQAPKEHRNKYLQREIKNIQAEVFHTLGRKPEKKMEMVNDCMSCLRVSDSEPLDCKNLVLCQKVDVSVNGTHRDLPLLRECIKPGVDIVSTITVDTRQFPYSVEEIEEAIQEFMTIYEDIFSSKFQGMYQGRKKNHLQLLLGGGIGYVSKTDTYEIFGEQGTGMVSRIIEQTLSRKQVSEHKHGKDKTLGVSPHILKCTRYKGILYEMGYCQWHIEEV